MFKNYFTIALRNFWRNKTFSLINIFGLSIGISASLVIYLLVNYHFNFDRFDDASTFFETVVNIKSRREDIDVLLKNPREIASRDCAAFSSKVTLEDKIDVTKNNLEALNGTYEILPFVVKSKSSNWYIKNNKSSLTLDKFYTQNVTVENSEKHIRATYMMYKLNLTDSPKK